MLAGELRLMRWWVAAFWWWVSFFDVELGLFILKDFKYFPSDSLKKDCIFLFALVYSLYTLFFHRDVNKNYIITVFHRPIV